MLSPIKNLIKLFSQDNYSAQKQLATGVIKKLDNWQQKKIRMAKAHQIKAFETLNDGVVVKRHPDRKIQLENGEDLIDFASCSYLGLDFDPRVIEASRASLEDFGINFAIARTRLRVKELDELEDLLSKILCHSHVVTFSSLHLTHLGLISLLSSGEMPSYPIQENGLLFIMDKTAHASMQINRGLMAQFGNVIMVDFQSDIGIYSAFQQAHKQGLTPISFSDSIGSMGKVAPIATLLKLAEKFKGYVYVDDAHGTSIYGKNGCGYVLDLLGNEFHPRLLLAVSLSKGFGTNAATIALPTREDKDVVKHFCTPYLFSNPPALSVVSAAIASAKIHLSNEITALQNRLWKNVRYFDHSLGIKDVINSDTQTPIRGVFIGDENRAIRVSTALRKKGFFVLTAMYPTVAKGKSMLRIALSSVHKKLDIALLCQAIKEAIRG